MCKLYYDLEYFTGWCSELVMLYKDLSTKINIFDERFEMLKKIDNPITIVENIEECDFVVLPFKWRGRDTITDMLIKKANLYNKKILVFFNDDSYDKIDVKPEEGFIFRTSFLMKTKEINEYSLIPFFKDEFDFLFIPTDSIDLTIGFCGFDHYERKKALEVISANDKIKTDFIIRKSFWAKEIPTDIATIEFNNNIKKNLFNFCSRGSGNFSYRFYQVLSMGRIPVLLNTDTVLPFYDSINYQDNCLIIDVSNINKIDENIISFYNSKDKEYFHEMQKKNRTLYSEFLSPIGFINNVIKTLKMNTYKTTDTAFVKQLTQNKIELNNNYPQHWIQLITDVDYLIKNHEIKRFVDIGCGCGATKELIKRHFPDLEYIGYDYSEKAIELAKESWGDKFCVKDCFDFTNSDFKKTDIIYMSALGDVLNNANDLIEKMLKLNLYFVLFYRVRITNEASHFTEEICYDDVKTYAFYHNENELMNMFNQKMFNYTINSNNHNSKNILLIKKTDVVKLHLGCGEKKIDGFINIDIRPLDSVDVVDDIKKLDKFKESSIDLIYVSHVLEHFGRHEYMDVLNRWFKLLKPNGILRVSVPDFEQVTNHYMETKNLKSLIGMLYGGQTYKENYHYNIWDFQAMKNDLISVGFIDVKRYDWSETEHSDIDDYSQAYLPHMDKENGRQMSLNIEAIK